MAGPPRRSSRLAAKVNQKQKSSPSCIEAGLAALDAELTTADARDTRLVLWSHEECSQMIPGCTSRVKDTIRIIIHRLGYGLTYPSGFLLGLLEGLLSETSGQESRLKKLDDMLQELDSLFFLTARWVALIWTFSFVIYIVLLLAIHC